MTSSAQFQRFLERQLASFEKFHFRTNDILSLAWHQPVRVNGKQLKLGTRAFTVLLLLAARAVKSPGDFFETDALVGAIERKARILGDLHLSWDRPSPPQVHAAVCDLRRVLRRKRLTVSLIESARWRSGGYRLSIPPMNIITDDGGAENLSRLAFTPLTGGNGAALLEPALILQGH
jgi:DNA-binding winged helix-turn-helix (wHTH) protein